MLALIAPEFGEPNCFDLLESPEPKRKKPTDILVKIAAASINGHDIVMTSGKTRLLQVLPMPYPIGLDFAGEVLDADSEITGVATGDKVYGVTMSGGAAATHLLLDTTKTHGIGKIPPGLSMAEAASLPVVGITADLGLKRADEFFRSEGGLRGKTVFIPGALSGVGSVALQIAKRLWGCKTLSAVSTAKVQLVGQHLGEGVVDVLVDYTRDDVVKTIGKGAVDFVFDTTGLAAEYLPMIRRGGFCLSIARLPPGSALKNEDPDTPRQSRLACVGQNIMDGMDAGFRTWAKSRYGVTYVYQKTEPTDKDVVSLSDVVTSQNVRSVVGKTATLSNLGEIRSTCMDISKGRAGVGKFVITTE